MKWKMVGVEYRRIIWRFKNRPHIYVFLTKNFYGFETVFALWFSDFPILYMRITQSENSATNIHTNYRQSETAPYIYAHYTRGKFRPRYIWELRRVLASALGRLQWCLSACQIMLVCVAVVAWRTSFYRWLVWDWDCKSVMGLYKFIVKMWLCICNCMCICVCMWCWL